MENRAPIRLDVANMLEERLGTGYGIKREEVSSLSDAVEKIHEKILLDREEGRLGFTELIQEGELLTDIQDVVEDISSFCENFVVLGMGGSALGNQALFQALRPPHYNLFSSLREGRPRLFITNNVDPDEWMYLLENLDLTKTVFNVISKSGTTTETMALYLITREMVEEKVGSSWPQHFLFTTSPHRGVLYQIKEEKGMTSLPIPENVGGRFSIFSAVGLLSSAVVGINIQEVLAGARAMDAQCQTSRIWENPAYLRAVLQYLAVKKGLGISVMMPYAYSLEVVADWYLQLAGESLGKRYNREGQEVFTGFTPVKAVGATDQHSQLQLYMEGPLDKVITFLEIGGYQAQVPIPETQIEGLSYLGGHTLGHLLKAEKQATAQALTESGRMNCTIFLPVVDAYHLGQLFYLLQLEVAMAGELYRINAFDQPGVERGKEITRQILRKNQ